MWETLNSTPSTEKREEEGERDREEPRESGAGWDRDGWKFTGNGAQRTKRGNESPFSLCSQSVTRSQITRF